MRAVIILSLLATTACTQTLAGAADIVTGGSPAPCQQVVVDDQALDIAWRSFDFALDVVGKLRTRRVPGYIPGTPEARAKADLIDRVTAAFGAAENAAAACSRERYEQALRDITAAISNLRRAIGADNGGLE